MSTLFVVCGWFTVNKKKKKENTHKEKERNHKRFYMINPMCSMLVRLELETDFARLKNHELLPSLMGV